MAEEYKKYDSDIDMECRNVRLTDDAKKLGDNFVKLTFCATSSNENDEEMWWDVIPIDRDAPVAAYLKKGDVLTVTGLPTMHRFGDDNEKVGFTLKRARLHIPVALFMECKERGFEPQAGKKGGKAQPKKGGKVPPKGRRPVDLDDDDEDLTDEE